MSVSASVRPLASVVQWRDALVRALVTAPPDQTPPAYLGAIEEAGATVILAATGQLVALLEWPAHSLVPYQEMRQRLLVAQTQPRPTMTHVVLLGGGDEAWRLALELQQAWRPKRKFAYHALDLAGDLRDAGPSLKVLERAVEQIRTQSEPIPYLSPQEIEAARGRFQEVARSEQTTIAQLNARGSPATVALIASVLIIYAFQMYLGDVVGLNAAWEREGNPGALLLQMGALWPPAVERGQWWRLISCMFLHGSLMHVGVNAWSIWALGRFVEKVLGTSRYIILYTVSGIIGSVASSMLPHLGAGHQPVLGVGASGAIFGLLGGLLALTYMRTVLPQSIAERLRRSMWPVLLLNLVISAAPGIDASAHFGGMVGGLSIAGSGMLTWGMPNLFAPATVQPKRSWPAIIAAVACVVLMVVAVGSAFYYGRPWEMPQ